MIIPVYFKTFQSNFPYHFSNYPQIVLLSTEKTLHCAEGWEGKATSNKANKKNAAEAIFYWQVPIHSRLKKLQSRPFNVLTACVLSQ